MDIVEFLRSVEWMCHSDMRGLMENDRPYEAADEIERLRNNAKQDAQYLLAYHRICQKHGIAPSSSDLIEALKEKE